MVATLGQLGSNSVKTFTVTWIALCTTLTPRREVACRDTGRPIILSTRPLLQPIPIADRLYDEHGAQLRKEGKLKNSREL
jgi:hypothetical protein